MSMRRISVLVAAAFVLGGSTVALAGRAAGWRVFATGTANGQYGSFVSASADTPHANALAVRATSTAGKLVEVTAYVSCQFDVTVPSGLLIVFATPRFAKCSVNGNANTNYGGRVRVELLRR